MGRHSRDLDGWAAAMEVGNDDEALRELHRLLGRLLDSEDRIKDTARSVSKAPNEEVRRSLDTALNRIDLAVVAIDDALRMFAAHERG